MPTKKLQNRINSLFADLKVAQEEVELEPRSSSNGARSEVARVINKPEEAKEIEPPLHGQLLQPRIAVSKPLSPQGLQSLKSGIPIYTRAILASQGDASRANTPAIMSIPFLNSDLSLALIEALDDTPNREWSDDERRLVEDVADQLSLALKNANLLAREQEQRRVADGLSDLSNAVGSSLNIKEITLRMLDQLSNLISFHAASFHLIRGEYHEVITRRIYPDGSIGLPISESEVNLPTVQSDELIYEAYQTRLPVLVADLKSDVRAKSAYAGSKMHSWLCAPLVTDQKVLGFVVLEHTSPGIYTPETVSIAKKIASQTAVAIRNARSYEEQFMAAERLRELDKLKSKFFANMSHELRTLLNSIIGFSRVVLEEIDRPISDLQQQDITAIHNAGAHLLDLINDGLDISKIEAGKMELAFEEVNLTELVDSVITTAEGLFKEKSIRLERSIEANLPLVQADSTRIRQVLLNFLSNAAEYTDEGSITVRVFYQDRSTIGDHPKGSEIIVSVIDSGPGIAPEDQMKLFQPFFQLDPSRIRKTGGLGLGLSISRLLIELHGGRIGVHSTLGQGATFFFTLPLPTTNSAGFQIPG